MTNKEKGLQPAFPLVIQDNAYSSDGLTKREYFAGLAIQGILANPEFLKNYQDVDIHVLSVKNADELLKQLNQPETGAK